MSDSTTNQSVADTYSFQPGKDYTFDSIPLETPLPETATIPVTIGTKKPGDVVAPLVPVVPLDTVAPADTTYQVPKPAAYAAGPEASSQPLVATAEGAQPAPAPSEAAPSNTSILPSTSDISSKLPSTSDIAAKLPSASRAGEVAGSAAGTIGGVARSLAETATGAVKSAAQSAAGLVQQVSPAVTGLQAPTETTHAPIITTSAIPGTPATTLPTDSTYASNLAPSGPGAAALPGGGPLTNTGNAPLSTPAAVHIIGTPAYIRPTDSTYEEAAVSVPTVAPTSASTTTTTGPAPSVSGVAGLTSSLPSASEIAAKVPSASEIAAKVPPAPEVGARAGELAGTAAGTVGGTLATAAELAKNAAANLYSKVAPAPTERAPVEEHKPDLLVRAAATTGSVAGSVAGTLATLAGAAKNAATAAVHTVLPSHTAAPETERALSTEVRPEQKYDLAYNAGNLAVVEGDESLAVVPPSIQNAPTSRAGEGVPSTLEQVGNTATLAAKSAASAVSNTVSSAATTAGNAAGAVRDTAASTASAIADRAIATKDAAVDQLYGAKQSADSAATVAADKVAGYTAGAYPNTGSKYELTESELLEPTEDIRPAVHSALNDDVHTSQRAITAGPSSEPPAPTSTFSTGRSYATGEDVPAPILNETLRSASSESTAGHDLSLPSDVTDSTGLLSEEAIRAVVTPATQRNDHQQDIVNSLLLERDLTSVGQPDVERVTIDPVYKDLSSSATTDPTITSTKLHSALPADEAQNEPPSDVASTRSLAPDSILERGDLAKGTDSASDTASSSDEPSSTFEANATVPSDPVPGSLASIPPSTDTIPEQPAEEDAAAREPVVPAPTSQERYVGVVGQGEPKLASSKTMSSNHSSDSAEGKNGKASKAHGIMQKAIGKIEQGAGKIFHSGHLVEVGSEKHAAGAAEVDAAKRK
ncbi:hypothetical protein HDV00_007337 [Rhizophlyctis rosea]|nr:hypothetical protein HDV00_007337 [Rhizophlyctis rosea]